MPSLTIDIDRLSDDELTDLATKLCRRLVSRGQFVQPIAIPGDDQQPIGFLVPVLPADAGDVDAEFIAELKRRIDNPPDRYLTVEEFFAALDAESSPAAPG
jgi:hypothetical protein